MFEKSPQENKPQISSTLESLDQEINTFEQEINQIDTKISNIQSKINEHRNNSDIYAEIESIILMGNFYLSKMNKDDEKFKTEKEKTEKEIKELENKYQLELDETGLSAQKQKLENQRDIIENKSEKLKVEKDTLLFNEEKKQELIFLEKEHTNLEEKNNHYLEIKKIITTNITEKIKEFTDYGMSESAAIEAFRKRENEKEFYERENLKTYLLHNLNEIIPILENLILDIEIKQEDLNNLEREDCESRNKIKYRNRDLTDENILREIELLEKNLKSANF